MNLVQKSGTLIIEAPSPDRRQKTQAICSLAARFPVRSKSKTSMPLSAVSCVNGGLHDMYMGTEIYCTCVVHGDAKTQCKCEEIFPM